MAELADFKKIAADFADIADFTTTYVFEAHASDGWVFTGNVHKIKQHNSLQERLLAASILLEDDELTPPGTFLVDNMNNQAAKLYGAVPERLYIVLDGVVVFEGGMGPFLYDVNQVREWLQEFKGKQQ